MQLEQNFITMVRNSIDFAIGEDDFPIMGSVLIKSGVATHKQLDELEKEGYIKSVTIDVPSVFVPTQMVKHKAYYTENNVPRMVQELIQ